MEINDTYYCQTPIVLIMFNRPKQTSRVIEIIRKVKPTKLFVISDGPRNLNEKDKVAVHACRSLIKDIDWECEVLENFSIVNQGCRRRINSGLDWVFNITEEAIILEDDCLPNIDFFKFMDWGLKYFRDNTDIGMISGSNLIDFKFTLENRNGFSNYINIWGWGSWRRVWESHDKMISLLDVKKNKALIRKKNNLTFFESFFWTEVFKNYINSGSTWDFQLQHSFFRLNYLSVYPQYNLVENLGFEQGGTHTNVKIPDYVIKSLPKENSDLMFSKPNKVVKADLYRDKYLIKTIWSCNPITAIRLYITNLIRYLSV